MERTATNRFEARVRAFLASTQLLPVGARVLCAVSGGADSIAMLHALHRMRRTLKLSLIVGHVDHGLRDDSAADRERVHTAARALELPFATQRLTLPARQGTRETEARDERHAALGAMADAHDASLIALGHTATDRAETWLYFATRGAGRRGLSSMRAQCGRRVRPLLDVTREEVRAYVSALGLPFSDDPTNQDRSHARNRIRLDVLPALRAINPEVDRHLAALARDFESEEAWLHDAGRAFAEEQCAALGPGVIAVPAASLAALPPPIGARAVAALWTRATGPGGREGSCLPRAARLAVLDLATRTGHRQAKLPRACASREGEHLVFRALRNASTVSAAETLALRIDAPGAYAPRDGINVEVSLLDGSRDEQSTACVTFDADAVSFPLWFRPPRRGDRMRLSGGGRQKVGEQLKDARVPSPLRAQWLLLASDHEVLWVPGVRTPQTKRVTAASRTTLRVQVRGLMFVDPYVKQLDSRVSFPDACRKGEL